MTEVASQIVRRTSAQILARALEIAAAQGLPVTSWSDVSPTRIMLGIVADAIGLVEDLRVQYLRSAWGSTAALAWKRVIAQENFGIEPGNATYAAPTVTVENTGNRYWAPEPGDLVFGSTVTGKTYHNTSDHRDPSEAIGPGDTRTIALVADEAGSSSAVAVDEIDLMITPLAGVAILSSTLATALDDPSGVELDAQMGDVKSSRSPNGAPDVPAFYARTAHAEINRATTDGDTMTGQFTTYILGPTGVVSAEAKAAAQLNVDTYANPMCGTPEVDDADATTQAVTVVVSGTNLPVTLATAAQAAIAALISALPIGGTLSRAVIQTTVASLAIDPTAVTGGGGSGVAVTVTTPAADVVCDPFEGLVPGTITVTI